jgi:hypothetical protein
VGAGDVDHARPLAAAESGQAEGGEQLVGGLVADCLRDRFRLQRGDL